MGTPYVGPRDNAPQRIATKSEIGGGGGIALQQATINIAAPARAYAEVLVVDAGVTPSSKIFAHYERLLDAENDLEEISDTDMSLAAVAEVGQIRFVLSGNSPFVGSFPVTYQVYP